MKKKNMFKYWVSVIVLFLPAIIMGILGMITLFFLALYEESTGKVVINHYALSGQ